MGNPRAEVTGRVDGVAGGAAERKSDGDDKETNISPPYTQLIMLYQ